jgi:UDP:flavonoid glycosyltransferase YjiC (YdhE family)
MKRKKVLLIGPPFSGHLHPLLGIGQGIATVADVLVLSTPKGLKAASASGLQGREIMAEHEHIVLGISEPGHAVKNNPLRLYAQLKENVGLMARLQDELEVIFRAEKPDLVIADFVVPVAGITATRLGIPWWTTIRSPCVIETPDGPPAYFNGETPARTSLQRVKHAAMRLATKQFKRLVWLLFRREFRQIGFHGIYRADGSEAVYSPQRILVLGVREIEFPCIWPRAVQFVGPVLHTPPFNGPPPVFPDDGRPCVLISIGTHLVHAKMAVSGAIREIAARHPGIVFHFTHGNASATVGQQEGNYHEYAYISYMDHLPRYDAVVHHAGAGVMNHCLRHGLPAVVHPLDFDQFDNAARLVAAGVALPAKKLADLKPAILRVLHDESLKAKCAEMSRIFAAYDDVGTIAKLL